jgi:ankyrin repeat protein
MYWSKGSGADNIRRALALEAPLNSATMHGETALMFAARNGRSWLVKFLIKLGADTKLKDKEDKSAYDYFLEHSTAPQYDAILRQLQ